MKFQFSVNEPVIRVEARVIGPAADHNFLMILDTGASRTVISAAVLGYIGCLQGTAQKRAVITSATDHAQVPIVHIPIFTCLGKTVENFEVFAHTIPAPPAFAGLLGLDFLRGHQIEIDLRRGILSFK